MNMKNLNEEQKLTLNFIMKESRSEMDLRWKLGKYINSGDLSYLGTSIIDLKKEIDKINKPSASISATS